MTDNPYQPPTTDSVEEDVAESSTERPVFRRSAMWAMAVLWNVPVLIVLTSNISGWISDKTMFLLMAACALCLSVFVVATAWSPLLRRLLFASEVDVKVMRTRVWGPAIMWAVIGVLIIVFTLGFGR